MVRELRVGIYSLDGRRLFDWREPPERRTPIFGGATRPGDVSRAIFRLRNEDVGPISNLRVISSSGNVRVRDLSSDIPVFGEISFVVDFTGSRDYALSAEKVLITFRGDVMGIL